MSRRDPRNTTSEESFLLIGDPFKIPWFSNYQPSAQTMLRVVMDLKVGKGKEVLNKLMKFTLSL